MNNRTTSPLISIIVPVYNVEPYLYKCIDSIINQTYKNLEIILVDDGSPDNCGVICDEYAQKDNRIKVIHKTNGGLSDARNAGLNIAAGEWISFIDSDDWIEPTMYEVLLNLAQNFDSQISVGGVADEIYENGKIITVKTTNSIVSSPYVLSRTQAMQKYFLGSWSAWDKIYRREIFDNIRFPVGEINEDEAIVLQILENASNISYTNQVFYHYIKRPESITTTSFHPKKLAWYYHCKANLSFIKENYPSLTEYAEKRYFSSILFFLIMISRENDQSQYSDILTELLLELKTNFKKIVRNNFLTTKDKFFALIFRFFGLKFYAKLEKIFLKLRHHN